MIRSSSYRRYFSTATPMHTGSALLPMLVTAWTTGGIPQPGVRPIASGTANTLVSRQATKMAAPLYSHLSCWRRSPPAWRYLGTWTTSQASKLATVPAITSRLSTPGTGDTGLARSPSASTRTSCATTACRPWAEAPRAASTPAPMRTAAGRRHRPDGSVPSGNSQSRIATRTRNSGQHS
jgi:hypothetical protein